MLTELSLIPLPRVNPIQSSELTDRDLVPGTEIAFIIEGSGHWTPTCKLPKPNDSPVPPRETLPIVIDAQNALSPPTTSGKPFPSPRLKVNQRASSDRDYDHGYGYCCSCTEPCHTAR